MSLGVVSVFLFVFLVIPDLSSITYGSPEKETASISVREVVNTEPLVKEVLHLPTPQEVKGIYMTSWVAGTPSLRDELIALIEETELNSLVLDIKDYSGKIAFNVSDPLLLSYGAVEERIPDIKELIRDLHDRGIYVIGRISVFQDPHLAHHRPDLAVLRESDGKVWRDYKGLSWLDPGSPEVWKYIIALARESHELGFDEINFDYIRFPSDGNMKDIYYPWSEESINAFKPASSTESIIRTGKSDIIRRFGEYAKKEMQGTGAVLSADFFGMTATNIDDLNIGQLLENALEAFDYVSPMVYPSHYPSGFLGYQNPASFPYEIVHYSMERAAARASTTPEKIRPWLQDFDLGADYSGAEVRAQIQATYDAGLTSWLLWNASNRYTRSGLEPSEEVLTR